MRGWIERKPRGQSVREVLPVYQSTRLAAVIPVIPTVKAVAVLHSISMVPVRDTLRTCRRIPVSACPNPTVFMPPPVPADPDESRSRAGWHGLYDGRRHWRRFTNRRRNHHDRCWSHDQRSWKGDSKVDSEMNSSVYSGDCHSRQSQNCDSLFHNHYQFDAVAEQNIITRELRFCKRSLEIPARLGLFAQAAKTFAKLRWHGLC
jgi:hypothetical protein